MSQLKKKFSYKYICALSIIAILLLLEQLLIQGEIRSQKSSTALINVAGKQRMYSQEIAKDIYALSNHYISNSRHQNIVDKYIEEIQLTNKKWSESHQLLLDYSNNEAEDEGLIKTFSRVNEAFQSIQAILPELDIKKRAQQTELQVENNLDKFSQLEQEYLLSMDEAVSRLSFLAEAKIAQVQQVEALLFLFTIIVLIAEALFIFKPAVRELQLKEYALIKAKDVAEEGVKAKSRFLATMSHEIRTPMNAILSCTNLLLDNHRDSESQELLTTVKSSGDSLLTLINEILDFSKIESGKINLENESFQIHEVVKEVTELLKPSGRDISLTCDIDSAVPQWVTGDSTRLRQVLVNLVSNAIKFTNSKVEIKLSSKEIENNQHRIEFSVIDDGIGISEEGLDKLFKDFSQVDGSTTRKFGGTGLGLAICKGLTEAMGGEIWVKSELHQGSVFSFAINLSVAEAKTTQVNVSAQPSNMAEEHPLKILLAEDNTVNQMVAKKIIGKLGYRIDITANGLEALTAAKKQQYDVIFMDLHMPEMDGIEATQ